VLRRLAPVLLLVLGSLPCASAGAVTQPSVSVGARPALFPRYSPEVTDYVTRCRGERGVRLDVGTKGGARVVVAGRRRGGRFSTVVHVAPGHGFAFRVEGGGRSVTHHVRCLPPKFPLWTFQRFHPSPARLSLLAPGLTLGKPTRPYAAIFDQHGVPLWWYAMPPAVVDAELLPDRTLAFARFEGGTFGTDPRGAYEIRSLDGRLLRSVRAAGSPTDDHELQLTPAGNYMLLSYVPRPGVDLGDLGGPADATVVDAEIQIVDRRGHVVWRWSSMDHIALAESAGWPVTAMPVTLADGRRAYDLVHPNSLQLVGGTIVLSLRHTSAVYGIDRGSGRILWKLGGTPTPESLAVEDDSDDPILSGQHFARMQRDGTLTVHDNGTIAGRPPRALRFRIDTARRTATLIQAVADPAVTRSPCCGSATRFEDGRWLISWGGASLVGEYGAQGAPLWRLTFGGDLFSYRAIAIRPRAVTRPQLRAAMNALNPRR
jgi:hypothetical protein